MRKRDLFLCGAALFAMTVLVCLPCLPMPAFSSIFGGVCALISAVLLWCGLQENRRERSEAESRRVEEDQKLREENSERLRELFGEILEEMRTRNAAAEKSFGDAAAALLEKLGSINDIEKEIFRSLNELRKETARIGAALEKQGDETKKYQLFMLDRPWDKLPELANSDLLIDQISDVKDELAGIKTDLANQVRTDGDETRSKLDGLTAFLGQQNEETLKAMERIANIYSDVTTQDIELLDKLTKEFVK